MSARGGEAHRAYLLPARWVIHTVGPIWRGGRRGEEELLRDCYRHTLLLAERLGARSVAIPAISTGAYGYPLEQAVPVAVEEVTRHLEDAHLPALVRFVVFSEDAERAYRAVVGAR